MITGALLLGLALSPLPATPTANHSAPREVTRTAAFRLMLEPIPVTVSSGLSFRDLDGDGRADAYGIAPDDGGLIVLWQTPQGFTSTAMQRLPIRNALLAVEDIDPAPGVEVVFADEHGVHEYVVENGRYSPLPRTVVADGLDFPPHGLELASFLKDVNKDGRADLLLPRRGHYEVRLQREPGRFGDPRPIPIEVERSLSIGDARPGQTMSSGFNVPELELVDLNGDGRDDIVLRRDGENRYYLQSPDGTYPAEPSFALRVKDYAEDAGPPPEGIMAQLENLRFTKDRIEETDLDGDGIRDYVVLTSRRVVAFHGTRTGVAAADPWQVLRFGAAIGNVLLLDVNGDGRDDLFTVRIDLPTIPRLLVGLFAGFTIDLRVLAFFTAKDGTFSRKPDRANTLHLEIPPILDIIRHPEEFQKKLEPLNKLKSDERHVVDVDLGGSGRKETLVFDGKRVEVRRPLRDQGGASGVKEGIDGERRLGSLRVDEKGMGAIFDEFVFNPERTTYNIDNIVPAATDLFRLVATMHEAHRAAIEAQPVVALGELDWAPKSVEVRDVDGDGRPDIILHGPAGQNDMTAILWNRMP